MSDVTRLILSNTISFIDFMLVVFYSVHKNRDNMLRILQAEVIMTIITYVILGCHYAAAASVFAMLRNQLCLKYPGSKDGVLLKITVLLVGTSFSAWCAFPQGTWSDYLPAVSFMFTTTGYFITKSSSTLKIVDALDNLLFWLIFDYLNLMVFLVVIDLFVVLFPIAERYVKMDRLGSGEDEITVPCPAAEG